MKNPSTLSEGRVNVEAVPFYKDNIIVAPLAPTTIFACQGRKAAPDLNVSALSPWEAQGCLSNDGSSSSAEKAFQSTDRKEGGVLAK